MKKFSNFPRQPDTGSKVRIFSKYSAVDRISLFAASTTFDIEPRPFLLQLSNRPAARKFVPLNCPETRSLEAAFNIYPRRVSRTSPRRWNVIVLEHDTERLVRQRLRPASITRILPDYDNQIRARISLISWRPSGEISIDRNIRYFRYKTIEFASSSEPQNLIGTIDLLVSEVFRWKGYIERMDG